MLSYRGLVYPGTNTLFIISSTLNTIRSFSAEELTKRRSQVVSTPDSP